MPYDIINEIKIAGLQFFNRYDKLNPVEVSIKDSEVNTNVNRLSSNNTI